MLYLIAVAGSLLWLNMVDNSLRVGDFSGATINDGRKEPRNSTDTANTSKSRRIGSSESLGPTDSDEHQALLACSSRDKSSPGEYGTSSTVIPIL